MSAALDRFFEHYYGRRPVNATFTGVHDHDARLPDWSPAGLRALRAEMRTLHADLAAAHPTPQSARQYRDNVDLLDAELARAYLEIQLAEGAGMHGVHGNPALWTGEAIFSVIALMIRDFAPLADRQQAATARLDAIPGFLAQARDTMAGRQIPAAWTARALRECEGASLLLTRGVDAWLALDAPAPALAPPLRAAAARALEGFHGFGAWLRAMPAAPDAGLACGNTLYALLLARGHQCPQSASELLVEARARIAEEKETLDDMCGRLAGSLTEAQQQLAADHPHPESYLDAFTETWRACRTHAAAHDVVTWPEWPIRYVTLPDWTRDAAPYLYYLFYRSPAPHDPYGTHDYVVPPLPAADPEAHLRTWNHSAIKLNHVVHHGGIGHHVQNWHACHRAPSRIGRVAAVDCASRIGMFSGGTMAEGWACYATGLMDELGFLTPAERLSEQHSRVRFLSRAIVDIEFHRGAFTFDDAVRFHIAEAGMDPATARAEVVKCSMFPATAVMYWLGTRGILDLRARQQRERGASFSLKGFHDDLLGHGSIPVPLIARLMTEDLA